MAETVIPLTVKTTKPLTKPYKVWSVISGKGGVGKSFVASSMAIALAKSGIKTTLIDLDFHGANLHTFFGRSPFGETISSWVRSEKKLKELASNTHISQVKLITGYIHSWAREPWSKEMVNSFFHSLGELHSDYIILDLGTHSNPNAFDFLLQSDETFLVTTPEPTSVEATYRWIEDYLMHQLAQETTPEQLQKIGHAIEGFRRQNPGKPFAFKKFLKQEPFNLVADEIIKQSNIKLICNQIRSFEDETLGAAMKSVINKYYNLNVNNAGFLQYDNAVWQSIRNRSHALIEQPFNPIVGQILAIARSLADQVQTAQAA